MRPDTAASPLRADWAAEQKNQHMPRLLAEGIASLDDPALASDRSSVCEEK